MSDRIIHAERGEEQIVRYDRSGKWYIEHGPSHPRERVSVRQAARRAFELGHGGIIYERCPGGRTFDRLMRELTKGYLQ